MPIVRGLFLADKNTIQRHGGRSGVPLWIPLYVSGFLIGYTSQSNGLIRPLKMPVLADQISLNTPHTAVC